MIYGKKKKITKYGGMVFRRIAAKYSFFKMLVHVSSDARAPDHQFPFVFG